MRKTAIRLLAVSCFVAGYLLHPNPSPSRVICESGSFESVNDPSDSYLKEIATCNLVDSNGPRVTVLLID